MSTLSAERCVACRRDSPRVAEGEIAELRREVPDWQLRERDGIVRLERAFHFPNFAAALAFINRVGALAEEEGHHPALLTEWGRVAVTWWTQKIHGLHRNDFIMAAKTTTSAYMPRSSAEQTGAVCCTRFFVAHDCGAEPAASLPSPVIFRRRLRRRRRCPPPECAVHRGQLKAAVKV